MSTRLRTSILTLLKGIGVSRFVDTSGLGYKYLCHVGDSLGEMPFYNRQVFISELEIGAAWLRTWKTGAVVIDVGAHVGFWSTHIAQMARGSVSAVYAFEPVPATFCKLVRSVERLSLGAIVHPTCAAVLDHGDVVRMDFCNWDSMLAEVAMEDQARPGLLSAYAASITLDDFAEVASVKPALIKIDVEGSELEVLGGASKLLHKEDRPALLFEFNPVRLGERNASISAFSDFLAPYSLYYVDDFEGGKLPFGGRLQSLQEIDWVCNIFAVPPARDSDQRFATALRSALERLRK